MTGTAFIVVRGPPMAGKTAVARCLAERLPGKSAIVSQDDLATRWIVHHDDFRLETEFVYRQLRLLATSYIRGGYHVVVDASFAAESDGVAALHESDVRDLLGLVATLPNVRPLLVAVHAPPYTLLERSTHSERWDERAVKALYDAFQRDASRAPLTLDTSRLSPDECASAVLEHMAIRT